MKQSLFRFWATPTFSTGSQRAIITTPRGGFLALFLPLFSVQLIRLTCLNTVESTASLSSRPLTTDKPSETSSCVISSLLFSPSFPKLSLPTATNAMILLCNVHGRRRSASRKQKTAVKLIFALTSISSDFNDKKVSGAKRALAFTLTYYSSVLVFFCNCNMAL